MSTLRSCDLSCDCYHVTCHVTELWMSWLEDEEKLVGTDGEARKKVYKLFDRAVKDYLCKSLETRLFIHLFNWAVKAYFMQVSRTLTSH